MESLILFTDSKQLGSCEPSPWSKVAVYILPLEFTPVLLMDRKGKE